MSEPSTERFGKYLIRALNFGDVNQITSEAISLGKNGLSLDIGKMRFLTLKHGIVAPKLTDEQINSMDEMIAQELYRRILIKTGYSVNMFQKGIGMNIHG